MTWCSIIYIHADMFSEVRWLVLFLVLMTTDILLVLCVSLFSMEKHAGVWSLGNCPLYLYLVPLCPISKAGRFFSLRLRKQEHHLLSFFTLLDSASMSLLLCIYVRYWKVFFAEGLGSSRSLYSRYALWSLISKVSMFLGSFILL